MRRRLLALVLTAMSGSALAAPKMIFDASAPAPKTAVSGPEVAALKRLYQRLNRKICPDFEVLTRQQGQLTAPRQQTLYLIQNCYSDAAANPMRTRWQGDLLILDRQKLNYFRASFADDVTVLPALGQSELNTLLTETWFGPHMGEDGSVGELKRFGGGQFAPFLALGSVYHDTGVGLAPGESQGTATRLTLWYDSAQPARLLVRVYRSPICDCQTSYDPAHAKKVREVTVDLRHPTQNAEWQQP